MGNSLRILLVEDSPLDAELLEAELTAGGLSFHLVRVETREAMLDALHGQYWDIIVSDYNLPGFTGIEALLTVMEEGFDLPFIIVSGVIGESTAVEAMKAGAQDYLMKGNLSRLVPAIRNAIRANELKRMHAQAELELMSSREKLRRLMSHLEEVREQERLRIARELHDAIGANLTAIKMDVSYLVRTNMNGDGEHLSRLERVGELITGTILEVRRMISELRPSILDDLGLMAAIDWLLGEMKRRYGLEYSLRMDPVLENTELSGDLSVAVFRILQEALTNVGRHAYASRVDVEAELQGDRLVFTARDDGRGFDADAVDGRTHFGILGMQERVRNLNGSLEIDASPGKGCCLRVVMPAGAPEQCSH